MRIAVMFAIIGISAFAGCNNAQMSSAGEKIGGNSAKGSHGKDGTDGPGRETLGNRIEESDGVTPGQGGGNGKIGDNGNRGAKAGLPGETDDSITACVNKPLKTSVHLLTPSFKNGESGNKLVYEIQVRDCLDKPRPLSAQFIHFDIDAFNDDAPPYSYVLEVGGQTVSGILQVVDGVDLFGKAGPDYYHHKTDQAVALTAAALTATLTIDLKGQRYSPMQGGDAVSFTCQTYLRFGDTEPVARSVQLL